MSNQKSTATTELEAPAPADPMAEELAKMRQRLANLEAAVARLNETAIVWACGCGRRTPDQGRLYVIDGRGYCSDGHYQWYSQRGQE